MYPLRFHPIYRRYLWGGRRLQTVLDKELGAGDDFAESWEIVDHGEHQSVVMYGPLAGTRLGELAHRDPTGIFGGAPPQPSFPLLFKFLDANQRLSVQVHPNDSQAARQKPPDRGKTEAWVVLQADPGSVIYAGLKRGFDHHALLREVQRGTAELCLNRVEPKAGDCFFIPAGAVHALGAGLVIAELQQSSDTTFRLFDWNRVGADGRPRPLHVDQAMGVIDFERGPIAPQRPQLTSRHHVERLVACDHFVWERWRFQGRETVGGDDRFHLIAVIDGSVEVAGDPAGQPLRRGQTMLIPAACGAVELLANGGCQLLDAYLPDAGVTTKDAKSTKE